MFDEGAIEREENVQGMQGVQVQPENVYPMQGKSTSQAAPTLQHMQTHAITTRIHTTATSEAGRGGVAAKVEDICGID